MVTKKRIFIVFTLGVSLYTWYKQGIINREIEIYKSYLKYGWEVTFITYGNIKDKEIISTLYGDEFQVIPLREGSSDKEYKNQYINVIYSFKAILLLFFNKKNIDLVKSAQLYGCWVCAIYSILKNKPWLSRTGYDFFSFLEFDISKKNFFVVRYLKVQILKCIHLFFGKAAKLMIVSSKKDYENTRKWFKGEIIINSNWIYIPKLTSKEFQTKAQKILSNQKLKFIMVGRLEYQKRIDIAIDAIRKVNIDYSLDIYGSGSQLYPLMKRLDKNLSKRIRFLGNLENKKLIKKMLNYDILISTSEIEGTPKVILEAMGSGLIIIARKCVGNNELISDGENGYLFDDINNFSKILEILRNKSNKKIESLLYNNYLKIRNNHSIDNFALKEIFAANKIIE